MSTWNNFLWFFVAPNIMSIKPNDIIERISNGSFNPVCADWIRKTKENSFNSIGPKIVICGGYVLISYMNFISCY